MERWNSIIWIVVRTVLAVMLILVVGVVAIWYRLAVWPLHKLDRCYAKPGAHGVVFEDATGHDAELPLRSRNGKLLDKPMFVLNGSQLVYWSDSDAALGLVSGAHKAPSWYPVNPKAYGTDLTIRRMSADGRFVAMDVGSERGAGFVLLLDRRRGTWSRPDGIVEARIDPSGSGRWVVRTGAGEFRIGAVQQQEVSHVVCQAVQVWDWDYSFGINTLYVLENTLKEITIHRGTRFAKRFRLPDSWNGLAVFWQSGLGELWVVGHGAFSSPKSPVFSADGKYLGSTAMQGLPIYVQGIGSRDIRSTMDRLGVR